MLSHRIQWPTAPGVVSEPSHDRVTVDMDSKLPVQQVLWLLRASMGETLHRRLGRQRFADPCASADRMNCRSLATFHGTLLYAQQTIKCP